MGCLPSKAQLAVVVEEKNVMRRNASPVEDAVIDLMEMIREDSHIRTLEDRDECGLTPSRLSQIHEENASELAPQASSRHYRQVSSLFDRR